MKDSKVAECVKMYNKWIRVSRARQRGLNPKATFSPATRWVDFYDNNLNSAEKNEFDNRHRKP